jgi:hypothetical protein
LDSIRELIIKDGKKNKWINDDERLINKRFCDIFSYFDLSGYTKKCESSVLQITDNYDKSQGNVPDQTEKK